MIKFPIKCELAMVLRGVIKELVDKSDACVQHGNMLNFIIGYPVHHG